MRKFSKCMMIQRQEIKVYTLVFFVALPVKARGPDFNVKGIVRFRSTAGTATGVDSIVGATDGAGVDGGEGVMEAEIV